MPDEPIAEELAAAAKAKADADAAAAKAKADADAVKNFSQADLDRIAGDSRAAGRSAAEKELLASLGVADLDAAKALLAAAKEAEDAKLSEVERLTKERDEAKTAAEKVLADATQVLVGSKLEGALRDAGVNPERIAAAVRLVDRGKLAVDGTEVTGIAEAVEAVKAESPEWFGPIKTGVVDATGGAGNEGTDDFRTASRDALAAEAAKYGVHV